jgi:HlyD family secretion protein
MFKKVAIIVVVLGVLGAAAYLFVTDGAATTENENQTFAVIRGEIIDKALAVGRIEPRRQVSVKSKVAGLVRRKFVEIGDRVKIGDPLLDIAPDPTPVEFAEAKRQVEIAEVTFASAKRTYDRSVSMLAKEAIAYQEMEDRQAQYEESELRLKLATEKLALIESGRTRIAGREVDNIIKSPINGTVLSIDIEEGDPVVPLTSYQSGTELMSLAYMEDLVFKGNVDEIDVGKLRVGMEVELEVGALPNELVIAELTRISPRAHREEGATMFEVEAEITDAGTNFLRAGYSANADVMITKKTEILIAPERLIKVEDSVATCEVMDSAGMITTRTVTTGLSDGINIEIVEGLDEGEMLVERPPKEITGD